MLTSVFPQFSCQVFFFSTLNSLFIYAHLFSFSISSPVLNFMITFSHTNCFSLADHVDRFKLYLLWLLQRYIFFKMADTFQPTLELKRCIRQHLRSARGKTYVTRSVALMSGNECFTWTQNTTQTH